MIQEWPNLPCGEHVHAEHAKWACWLSQLVNRYEYRPRHFPVSQFAGFRPTFLVENRFWLHLSPDIITPDTADAAYVVADKTGLEVVVVQGALFTPRPHFRPPSPTLFVTSGLGIRTERYFGERHGQLITTTLTNYLDLFSQRIMSAFATAEAVGAS